MRPDLGRHWAARGVIAAASRLDDQSPRGLMAALVEIATPVTGEAGPCPDLLLHPFTPRDGYGGFQVLEAGWAAGGLYILTADWPEPENMTTESPVYFEADFVPTGALLPTDIIPLADLRLSNVELRKQLLSAFIQASESGRGSALYEKMIGDNLDAALLAIDTHAQLDSTGCITVLELPTDHELRMLAPSGPFLIRTNGCDTTDQACQTSLRLL